METEVLRRAILLWMPAAVKLKACREVSADFAAVLAEALEKAPGAGLEAYREAARETGRRAAARLRRDLKLAETPEDAEFAWRLVCKVSGMRASVRREEGRTVFEHIMCPVYAGGGARMCGSFCLPMVEGLTEGICPSCGVEVVREAAGGRACAKALIRL